MPQWMPQNIQKRLFKYILEQLSLFSEIDLQNLDVSLGSNAQVNLRSLELDIDKFSIPGVYIRSGHINELDLQLNVTGGVGMKGRGIYITLTPSPLTKNALSSGSPTGHGSDSSGIFSLSKSTIDLAKSTTFEDYVDSSMDDDEFMASLEETIGKKKKSTLSQDDKEYDTDADSAGGYKLSGMMVKAVDYALSKLQVDLEDVSITMVADPSTIEAHIDKIQFSSDGDVKVFDIKGIELRSVRPDVYPGEGVDSKKETNASVDSEDADDDKDDDDDDDKDDDDGDYDDEMMSTSFLVDKREDVGKSLLESVANMRSTMASSAFTGTETEFYDAESAAAMSASGSIARELPSDIGEAPVQDDKVILMFIDSIESSFHGLQPIEDVNIEVGNVKLAVAPLPEMLASFMRSLKQLKKLALVSQKAAAGLGQQAVEPEDAEDIPPTLIQNFNISQIEVSLTSALLPGGTFAVPGTSILVNNINMQQKNVNFYFGSIVEIVMQRDGLDLFRFSEKGQTDLKFELDKASNVRSWTLLFANPATLTVDRQLLTVIAGIVARLSPTLDQLDGSSRSASGKTSSVVSVKTADLNLILSLDGQDLSLQLSPVLFDSAQNTFNLERVSVNYGDARLFLDHIKSSLFAESHKIKGFDSNTLQEKPLRSYHSVVVDRATFRAKRETIQRLTNLLSEVNGLIVNPHPTKSSPVKRVRMASSILMGRDQSVLFDLLLRRADVAVYDIKEEFGGLHAHVRDLGAYSYKNGTLNAYVMSIDITRRLNEYSESFLSLADESDTSLPVIFIRHDPNQSTSIHLRNLYINYYGMWLKILGEQESVDEEAKEVECMHYTRREITIQLSDIVLGLSPVHINSMGALVVKRGSVDLVASNGIVAQSSLSSVSIFLIDDKTNVVDHKKRKSRSWTLNSIMQGRGFANIGSIHTVFIHTKVGGNVSLWNNFRPLVEMKVDIDRLKLALCADSAQCLSQLSKDLKEPLEFSFEERYKTDEKAGVDTYAGIDEDFFANSSIDEGASNPMVQSSSVVTTDNESLHIVEDYYSKDSTSTVDQSMATPPAYASTSSKEETLSTEGSGERQTIPFALALSIEAILIQLYDGYDWKETRRQITDAINELQGQADEDSSDTSDSGLFEETLFQSIHIGVRPGDQIDDIYSRVNRDIGPDTASVESADKPTIDMDKINKKLRLKRSKNHKASIELSDLDVDFLLVGDIPQPPAEKPVVFSEKEPELVSRVDISVGDLKIVDNVPTSSWGLFFGYLREAGEREIGASLAKISIDTVRPVASMAATELTMQVAVLPVRLYVDQYTLDFLTRFTEFQDSRFVLPADEESFIERIKIEEVPFVLDYKPKKVDYSGLRSGHTKEFMNFFILEESSMVLRSATLYGVPGFGRLNKLLNDFWLNDIQTNQLGGAISGVAPIKPLVKLGAGFKELFTVPAREYQKDGRILRSVQKGTQAFGKTTSGEILRLGVKLAAGTQAILENAEEMLGGQGSATRLAESKPPELPVSANRRTSRGALDSYDEDIDYRRYYHNEYKGAASSSSSSYGLHGSAKDVEEAILSDAEESTPSKETEEEEAPRRLVSLYSDQPQNLNEGLQTAYKSLGRNMQAAKDALMDAGSRASESGSAQTAAMEFARATPIMLIRPLIGTTEAISRALLGGLNDLDPEERKRAEQKYKKRDG